MNNAERLELCINGFGFASECIGILERDLEAIFGVVRSTIEALGGNVEVKDDVVDRAAMRETAIIVELSNLGR